MTPDEDKRMKAIEDSLKRIELGMFGDEGIGAMGIIYRQNNHAKRIKRLETWAVSLLAGATTIGLLYRVAIDIWSHK